MFSTPSTPNNFLDTSLLSADIKPSPTESEAANASKTAQIQAKLNRRLGPEYVSQRPSPGGGPKLTYVEGWKIIGLANEVFGYNGWSSTVTKMETDFIDMCEETRRFSVGVTAMVKITLKDGSFHEDVGYGTGDNLKSKGAALDKAKKEAVTDAIKRTLRNFGNVLGLCLYEKSYTHEIVKIKVQQPKFDQTDLHRRPEFDNSDTSTSTTTAGAGPSNYAQPTDVKPMTSVPPHLRPGSVNSPSAFNNGGKGKAPQTPQQYNTGGQNSNQKMGMTTPVQTPAALNRGGSAPYGQRAPTPQVPAAPKPVAAPIHQPQQPQPPPERKVTFAPPAQPRPANPASTSALATSKSEPEVDSYFTSDDDALLAAFDMNELDDGEGEEVNVTSAPAVNQNAGGSGTGGPANARMPSAMGNAANGSAGTASASAGGRPPSTTNPPSAGGFRFPAGVNPVNSRSYPGSASVAGIKRPAESMQPPKRLLPHAGMGLAQQQQPLQANGSQRQPFTALQVGEGGDVKRMRL